MKLSFLFHRREKNKSLKWSLNEANPPLKSQPTSKGLAETEKGGGREQEDLFIIETLIEVYEKKIGFLAGRMPGPLVPKRKARQVHE